MVEHWIADLKLIDSSFIRCNVFMKNFQEFLMTVQEKCRKFECGQNQRRQLLEQFFKVEWSLETSSERYIKCYIFYGRIYICLKIIFYLKFKLRQEKYLLFQKFLEKKSIFYQRKPSIVQHKGYFFHF